MNKYTGEVEIQLGAKKGILVFDWRAIAELQTKLGADAITDMFKQVKPSTIAEILLIGFKKKSPEVTMEEILDASPCLIPTVQAIEKAISFAYFGAEEPPKGGEKSEEKKTQ
jgi:hypothetical protein